MKISNELFIDWPNANKFGPSAEHLHALGAISLSFNKLEQLLASIFYEFFGIDRDMSDAMFSRFNNVQRIEVLRMLVERRCEPELKDLVLHGLSCFEVCAANRNTLAHIIHEQVSSPFYFAGRKRNSRRTKDLLFLMDLKELRNVADGMLSTYNFILSLSLYRFRKWHEKHHPNEPLNALMDKMADSEIPERILLPERINPIKLG